MRGWLSQGWVLLGYQRPPVVWAKKLLVGFVVSRTPERSHLLKIARVTSPVSWHGARQLHSSSAQIIAMKQCKQEQGLVTCSSLIPFCFYRCAVHGNEMISSSKHLSSERQTSFSQMHPSDKTYRMRAVGNLSESYFWIYYNQPYQLISYLQHINGERKDKYVKTCHGNLKMVGVFS